jgi:hypothetical protein
MHLLLSKQNITAIFFFIISISAFFDYPGKDNLYLYLIFLLYFSYMILNILINKSLILKVDKIGGTIAILFLLMWIYGQIIGHIRGNDLIAMMRNFAGMLLFIVFLAMSHSEISKDSIIRLIFFSSVAFIICNLFLVFNYNIHHNPYNIYIAPIEFLRFNFKRIYYNPTYIPIVSFLCVATISYIFGNQYIANKTTNYFNKKWKSKLFILTALIVLVFYGSKAVYGAVVINLFFIFLVFAYLNKKLWPIIKLCTFFVILAVIINYMFAYNVLDIVKSQVILETQGARGTQASEILNDTSVFGSGLGGVLSTGYARDSLGYGFELSFYSVIHKYGILSWLIFLPYLYMFIYSIYGVLYMSNKIVYLIALSMTISILICSYGNPLLFHPIVVFYTLLVLLLLSSVNKNFARSERCVE